MKKRILKTGLLFFLASFLFTASKKEADDDNSKTQSTDETQLETEAQNSINESIASATAFSKSFNNMMVQSQTDRITLPRINVITVVSKLPLFSALNAAINKTGLRSTLSSPDLNATVFAPIDAAFAKLPAPLITQLISMLLQIKAR